MTAAELISNHIPTLQATDTVRQAMDFMKEHRVTELPVVKDLKYIGLVHEEDLEDKEVTLAVETMLHNGVPARINPADFFLVPLKIMHQQKLSVLPVVKEDGELMGIITMEDLLQATAHYNSAAIPGGIIILQMSPNSFYISEIGRIVESNNAKIIHLNTWTDPSTGELMVAIKVNKSDIQDILSSFERYEYNIIQYFGENLSEEELRLNYDHLMNYLNI
ncbi:CBS domain-containing protein [Lacibacter sp. H407]|uniref:CBS domain-containing protein n=1 Tax=Lacibacter sp. H407 TaxID=3133423 RepID=UPI0030C6133B